MPCGHKRTPRLLNQGFIGKLQTPSETVSQNLSAETIHVIFLPLRSNVIDQARHARPVAAAGKFRSRVHLPTGEILCSLLAHRSIAFEGEPESVKALMASRAGRILAMPGEHVPQRQVHLGFSR